MLSVTELVNNLFYSVTNTKASGWRAASLWRATTEIRWPIWAVIVQVPFEESTFCLGKTHGKDSHNWPQAMLLGLLPVHLLHHSCLARVPQAGVGEPSNWGTWEI